MKPIPTLAQAALFALLLGSLQTPAIADEHRRDDGGGRDERRDERRDEHRDWHGGDIHRFHERDIDVWRGGRWHRGNHEGRYGWWWIVAGIWYFYPSPVYPYPDPYQPPVVVVSPEPRTLPHYLYYCGNPNGYYPYVARCLVPWQRVLSQPEAAPPPQLEGVPPPGYPPPQ